MAKVLNTYWGLIVVLTLSLFVVKPLFDPGFFPMHDDTQVVRVSQMTQALSDGHFPTRWVKDLGYGYGYPIFNFYAPLPYYIGALINVFGFDALLSTKAMMIIGILLSGVSMYFLAREFWGKSGGIIAGLFYMYAPYHALDIYVRGAVGEFWAYAFLPLMAYGLYKRNVFVGALGFAGVILSHNLTALMLIPFLIIALLLYFFIAFKNKKLVANGQLLVALLFGLGISAFYWLPALLELGYTNVQSQIGGGADFRDHFVCWQQLWDSHWGFGGSTAGCLDGLSLKIGKLHVLAVLGAILLALIHYNDTYYRSKRNVIIGALVGFFLSVFLTLEGSRFIWEGISAMAFLQYPWRFLIVTSFFTSFLAGAIFWFLPKQKMVQYGGSFVLIFLLLFFNGKLFNPQTIHPKSASDYLTEEHIKWTTSKISDEYMPKNFVKPQSKSDVVRKRTDEGNIMKDRTHELSVLFDFEQERQILLRIAPFPSWKVFIDGKEIPVTSTAAGLPVFVPAGETRVDVTFSSTPVEKTADIISMISIFVLVGGILVTRASRVTRFLL